MIKSLHRRDCKVWMRTAEKNVWKQFKKIIKQGPYYICCVCNRTLYRKSVIKLIKSSFPSQDIFKKQSSFHVGECICKTCHSNVVQGRLPCQAIVNNLYVDDVPTELENLKKLEEIIIAQGIVFEKVILSYAKRTTEKNKRCNMQCTSRVWSNMQHTVSSCWKIWYNSP